MCTVKRAPQLSLDVVAILVIDAIKANVARLCEEEQESTMGSLPSRDCQITVFGGR